MRQKKSYIGTTNILKCRPTEPCAVGITLCYKHFASPKLKKLVLLHLILKHFASLKLAKKILTDPYIIVLIRILAFISAKADIFEI